MNVLSNWESVSTWAHVADMAEPKEIVRGEICTVTKGVIAI